MALGAPSGNALDTSLVQPLHCAHVFAGKIDQACAAPSWRAWLDALPRIVADLARQWDLELGEPYATANVSYVVAARRGSVQVVLKVQWPHEECAFEAEALGIWRGDGAVRLLAHDAARHALLLERCLPGTSLANSTGVDALAVLIELLPRLWKPAGLPFKSLAEEAAAWASELHADWETAGQPCERALVDAAFAFLIELSASQGRQVLVHQDLHGENILAATRERWLAIDPKPLAGEREFALAPIIRSFEFGHSQTEIVDRLDRLSAALRLDRERARKWAIAQTMAWSFDSDYAAQHFETVRWLMAAD